MNVYTQQTMQAQLTGKKRGADTDADAVTGGGYRLGFSSNFDHGVDMMGLFNKYYQPINPEQGPKLVKEDATQIYATLADWAMNNPKQLPTVFKTALLESTNPILAMFPIVFTDEGVIRKSIMRFGRDYAEISVHNTNARNIFFTVESIEGHMQFTAQAILVDLYHLKTAPEGPDLMRRMLNALFANLWVYIAVNALYALRTAVSYFRAPHQLFPGTAPPRTVEELLEIKSSNFGIISREMQGTQKVINRANTIFNQEGEQCARMVLTGTEANFISTRDESMTTLELGGKAGVQNRMSTEGAHTIMSRYGDVAITTVPFLTSKGHDDYGEIFRTPVSFGSSWRHLYTYGDVDPAEFRTHMTDVYTCSWETDTWDRYTLYDAHRWDPHFVPMNADLRPGSIKSVQEGKLDREYLTILAEKLQKAGHLHTRTRTDYRSCMHRVDPVLVPVVAPLRNKDLSLYPAHLIGELSEESTPSSFLRYIYKAMHARLFDEMSAKDKEAYSRGVRLMKELSQSYESNISATIAKLTARDDVYEPNQWGGVDFGRPEFLKSTFKGLGTISGFLTIRNLTKRLSDGTYEYNDNSSSKLAGTKEHLDIIYAFLPVYEKLVRKLMTLTDNHAALSDDLLPRIHRHKDMTEIHKSMIVCSYFLVGAFTYPLAYTEARNSDVATETQETITLNKEIDSYLDEWDNNALLKKHFPTLEEVRAFVNGDAGKKLYDYLLSRGLTSQNTLPDTAKTKMAAKGRELIKTITADLAGYGELKTLMTTLFAPAPEGQITNIEKLGRVVDTFQRITGEISATGMTNTAPVDFTTNTPSQLKEYLRDKYNTRTGNTTRPETDARNLKVYMTQFHLTDEAVRNSGRVNIWRAGISALNIGGKIEYHIDHERNKESKGALFDEEHATSFGGTLFTAAPFIHPSLPPAPASGFISRDDHVEAAYKGAPPVDKQTHSRYASGYPITELMRGKADIETRAIAAYEKETFKVNSFKYWKNVCSSAGVNSDFLAHGLAFPYTGHINSTEKSDMDSRWEETHTYDPTLGFAARAVLMTALTLQNFRKWSVNNIPLPLFSLTLRPFEMQYMRSFPTTTAEPCGHTYFQQDGFDQIVSVDQAQKHMKIEVSLGSGSMVENNDRFYIVEHVMGDAIIGGCGRHAVNEGVSRMDVAMWREYVTNVVGNGRRMGHYSNFNVLQSFAATTETVPRVHVDIRGYWHREDFAHELDESPSFDETQTMPMYEGSFFINELYKFRADRQIVDNNQYSFENNAVQHERNHVCSQVSAKAYSHNSVDKFKLIVSKHRWGERLPGLYTKEQSISMLRRSDHVEGAGLKYIE